MITVEPLTGSIGAVVRGVDLSAELTEGEVAEVRAALLSARVV